MTSNLRKKLWLCGVLLVAPLSFAQAADSGWYLGGSVGTATIEAVIDDSIPDAPVFNEDDMGWKIFAGYNFGMTPVFDLGIEGGYVDLGNPGGNINDIPYEIDLTAWNIFGLIGFDIGPVGIFGKVGYVAWDAEAIIADQSGSDDGNDIGYGLGLRFNLASLEVRGEYELYDIEGAEDVNMWSIGLAYHFN